MIEILPLTSLYTQGFIQQGGYPPPPNLSFPPRSHQKQPQRTQIKVKNTSWESIPPDPPTPRPPYPPGAVCFT